MKTLLSIDGGGVRGVIAIAFLERIERLLGTSPAAPLASRIDLVGGTSTGAIVAGAIALGYGAPEIRDLYFHLAPRVFRRSLLRAPGLHSAFDGRPLKAELAARFSDRRLDSTDLRTAFALIMKRIDTGSPWIVSNNPNAPYWNDPADRSYVGNRHYLLADLIRASTAAPHYFAPEAIKVVEGAPAGLFIDGGVTPHNNPALALLQLVTVPAYGFGWPLGADRLTVVSIGTGTHRVRVDPRWVPFTPSAALAVKALAGMIRDGEWQVITTLALLGRTRTRWPINSEIGDLSDAQWPEKPLFEFLRYNVVLEDSWLRDELGMILSARDLRRVRQMDNPRGMALAYEIGAAAAEKMVRPDHLEAIGRDPATGAVG